MIRFVFAILCVGFSAALSAVEIDLQPKVVLDKKRYTLSDIAVVSGRLAKKMGGIVIGESPRPGTKIYLGVDQIKSRLYQVYPEKVDAIQWRGAKATQIISQGKALSIDKVLTAADAALVQWSEEQDFLDYDFSLVQSPNKIMLPSSGVLSFSTRAANNAGKAYKRMPVWVDVLVDGERYHSYQLWYRFTATKTAYIANKPLPKSTLLDKGMFERAVVDATQIPGLPVSQLGSIADKRLLVNLASGETLTFNVLESVPMVAKGELVEVDVNVAGVGIRTKAIALKNGRLQETINVLNPSTNDSYLATVIDRNKVRVE